MKNIATLIIISALFLAGCGSNSQADTTEVETLVFTDTKVASIIEQHPDIYLPTDTTWERTLYSGPIEQHELIVLLSAEDVKSEMDENGWTLAEEKANTLRFTKDDLMTTYSFQDDDLTLFIEPADLFDN